MSTHAVQFFAICGIGAVYFAGRHMVVRWWRGRFVVAMHGPIDADNAAPKARGK